MARAKKAEQQKAGADDAPATRERGPEVVVAGPQGGFRRLGRRFGPEPVRIALDALSEAELQVLIAEPALSVVTPDVEPE